MLLPYFLAHVVAIVWVVDVITTRQMLCLFYWLLCLPICLYMWQMLLPYLFVADVVAINVSYCDMLLPSFIVGWCYCHILCVAMIVWQILLPLWLVVLPFDNFDMIDVICVADVICQGGRWTSLLGGCRLWSDIITISGRWNSHRVTCFISTLALDCCTEPHPICGADGICLCSCSGMDYWPLYIGLLLLF